MNGLKTILSIAGKIKTVRKTKVSVTVKKRESESTEDGYTMILNSLWLLFFNFYLRHFNDYYISQQ